jgi:site-specific recombinase XerD
MSALTLADAARMIRAAVKNKAYRATPLGQLVGTYVRWFRNEYGATESTIRDYEAILARMSLLLADLQPLEVTRDDLRGVIDTWATRHPRTRAKVTSVIRSFWEWAENEGHVPFSPAAKIRRPRAPRKTAPLLPAHVDELLLGCARTARDRLALLVLLDCGVRRSELAGIRVRDLDLGRRLLTVFGKGQKERVIPVRGRIVSAARAYLIENLETVGRPPEPDDFLLYPEKRTPDRRVYWADPEKADGPEHGSPLVVPPAGTGRARRPWCPFWPEHAPCPPLVRHGSAPGGGDRGRLAGARTFGPLHHPRHLRPPRPP